MWNWADLVIILSIAVFAVSGYFKGFLRQLGDFVILVISFLASIRFYHTAAAYISSTTSIPSYLSKIGAFFLIWIIFQFVLNLVFYFIYRRTPEPIKESSLNRGLGALPGFLWGFVFVAIFLSLFVAFPVKSTYQEAVLNSKLGSYILSQSSVLEKQIGRVFGGAFNETLNFLTIKPKSGETVDLGYKTKRVKPDPEAEEQMLVLVNKERTKRGLKPLLMDEKLRELARAHSRDMFARGYFAHNNPDGQDPFERMDAAGIKYMVAGENLALAPSVELAHTGLMNSPGHRANILTAEYGKVGIGCIDGGQYGKMFSQEFTN